MNARSAISTANTEEDTTETEFYTYEEPDPYAHRRAFDRSVRDRCLAERRAQRARTQSRISRVSGFKMGTVAALVVLASTLSAYFVWGAAAGLTLQFGALLSSTYLISNDMRISITDGDAGWRRRHRLISFVLRQHHLDTEAE
jgi:hypothetical protein